MVIVCAALSGTLLTGVFPVQAQEPGGEPEVDSLRVTELYAEAERHLGEEEPYEALNRLGEALQIAMQLKLDTMELRILELIGDVYSGEGDAGEAIPYYVRVVSSMEFAGDTTGLTRLYGKIARSYDTEGVHDKAWEYYLEVETLLTGRGEELYPGLQEKMGLAALASGKADTAVVHFREMERMQRLRGEEPMEAWAHLVKAYRASGEYDSCIFYAGLLLENAREEEAPEEMAALHNNLGFYHTETGRYEEALDHYRQAVTYGERAGLPAGRIAVMEANMGVCYQNMNRPREARGRFNSALNRLKDKDFPAEKSRIENIMALVYYHDDDLYNAGVFCRAAIASAGEAGDERLLADAYYTYSRVLRAGNDPVNALEYYESYLAIRDSLSMQQKMQRQQLEQKKIRLERSENDLQLRLKEERVNELAINRLKLQLEQQEQAKELLMKENTVQSLKQDSLRQSLLITEKEHEVERQERQNRILEQEQKLARLQLEQEQRKQREAEQEIRLLEQKQRLDQLALEKQETQRKALTGIVVLMVLVVILVTGSLVLTRKKNQLLARQKKEIEEKNQDLEQKNEEISTQRDEIEAQRNMLYEQKEAIEQYNVEIMKSIEYAKRIQAATLPPVGILQEFIPGFYVLFRPRDVVSGDFYWMAHVEGKTVVVVADCTGHGVPGAFMSVMGMSMLKEIVQKEYLTHPGVVLRKMRKEIINSLGQKGVSGEQRDGMDMSVIEIDHEERRVQFAGAYNSLYLVRESRVDPPDIPDMKQMNGEEGNLVLYDIPADKMPVAYYERMDRFTTHEFRYMEGDRFYMYTDGFADQFGGEHGKKFKYKPFKRLILANAALEMEAQHEVMARTLDEWMGSHDQVDDICVMGLRL